MEPEVESESMLATQIVHWPGQDTPACDKHAKQLRGLGQVMGCAVSSTPCIGLVCTNCVNERLKNG